MTTQNRWSGLTLALQEAIYERLRGKGVGVLNVTLIIVDGELSCWSEPREQSFGPFQSTRDLANCLAKIEE